MKKLFNVLMLAMVMFALPSVAFAEELPAGDSAAKTTATIIADKDSEMNIEWNITAEEAGDGEFTITFDGTIKEGYHGYPMSDVYSAPIFSINEVDLPAEQFSEPLADQLVDHHGDKVYKNKATYVYTTKAEAGEKMAGYIVATICADEDNFCTSNIIDFNIEMPSAVIAPAAKKAVESESTGGEFNWDEFWSAIFQAIAWGFIALVTPCVFPMVPMTVSFFVKGSQTPAQGRFRALMYGVFIVALYVLPIALIMALTLFGIDVSGDIFNFIGTHWIPNLIFFLIFMVFAASFFGAFEITMPSKLVNKSDEGADRGGLIGIFFMALTLVLVSFSCTGPIVGSVIIQATSGSTEVWVPIVTMAAFAIAFALPFTLLAWFPSLLKNLPKSGGWLNSVKVVLGFIELALGLKFLMTADQTMHWGLLDREVYLALWIVIFSLLGFYLLGKLRFAHDDEVKHVSVFRLTLAIAVFSFVVYLIPGMFGAPLKAISGYIPPMTTQDYQVNGAVENVNAGRKYADFLHLPHQLEGYFDFDEAVEAAKASGKPIFVDVTGHACNNCREMETLVWSNDKVLPKLREEFVICALYVDDMTKIEGGERLGKVNSNFAQKRWNVNAQPAYIILSPDGETQLAGPRGYDADVDAFVEFLNKGKNAK